MPLSPKSPKVVCEKGAKDPLCVTSATKSQISILACVSAAGECMPPMVIFDRVKLNPNLTIGEVPNTFYGLSKKGWMDTGLFRDWFMEHFLSYVTRKRPVLLLMDGHSSHYSPEMIRLAAKEKVILFVLPPNTIQCCQPLDKSVFSSLKSNWRQVCHEFMTENVGKVVGRYDFSSLFCETWDRSMTIKNIKSGFRVTGVCPQQLLSLKRSFRNSNPEHFPTRLGSPIYHFIVHCTQKSVSYLHLAHLTVILTVMLIQKLRNA